MKKTKIIAEMAWGHDGSIQQALDLMHAAKRSCADAISIHITDLDNYMVKHYGSGDGKVSAGRESLNIFAYLEKINLSNQDWITFERATRSANLELVVMPNDFPSLDFAEEKLNPDYYVISAACFVEVDFLRELAKKKRKTILRIGGAYLGEIENAINIFKKEGNDRIILLHGFQNYPTKLEETNVSQLKLLKEIFGCEVGLADHIAGGEPIAKVVPILAIAYGAAFIEKHITLDREMKSEDYESALAPNDFKEFVEYVRAAEIAIGQQFFKDLSEATIKYRNISRKRIVARINIGINEVITQDKICFKRSDIGFEPDKLDLILNRMAKENILKDDSITIDKLV